MTESNSNPGKRDRVILGILLIVIGGLFLLKGLNLGGFIGTWWPLVLVAVGFWQRSQPSRKGTAGPNILIGVGIVLLLHTLDIISIGRLWPILLIALGILLIVKKPRIGSQEGDFTSDVIDQFTVFGGGKLRVSSQNFRGGQVFTLFGGMDISLTDAKIASDGPATLSVTALFGGIDIWVPEDWNIALQSLPLFGGVEDNRGPKPEGDVSGHPTLNLKATAIFGGVEVK